MKISKSRLLALFAISVILNTIALLGYTYPRLINKFQQYTSQRQHTLQTANDTTLYINGQSLAVYGKYHNENNWYRFPSSLKEKLRPEVWELSKNSSGIYIDFSTNSPYLKAKWQLKKGLQPRNMTAIGASGLDLYVKENDQLKYVCSGIPDQLQNEQTLISGMDSSVKDFRIYLPLYNEVENFSIGIDPKAFHNTPKEHPSEQPIVFYGTSITQGGSASRPGMVYPSIISRILNKEVINFGFSGNGLFEKSVGDAIIEIDASIYVIDCTPNAHPITIQENALNLIKQLRATNKQTNKHQYSL
ncbi:SGNH/GDSL hydrolase family protein [Geofilum rubicundum]|uniref:Platelet-activating factor acetylhydrolase IB gamma subunit n=1 Tax=Geofilum rubicundum JCM 15548 TaxID=1236989 RepID=A0A0E9LY19_9BACT|nr:SGNH/GDSL hydrolase family protein [Geofilum rubicundum]GAO30457.1 Platelet-activating factor acetylhydrolase IB gamma subunit [Geofilum rubicundum JCM 15548]